jgi:predicted nucleic acid-binding protein
VRTLVDTSALYALLDEDDDNHAAAAAWLRGPGSSEDEVLVTHSYVVVESAALVHRRLGTKAARVLLDAFVPAMSVLFVDEELHARAVPAYLAGLRGRPSLVDRVSFQVVRDRALDRAFVFDRDFRAEGIVCVP